MSKAEPTIQKYMTYQPHAIEASESVETAQKMMAELKIRHLPVMNGSIIVGMISDRDIRMALSFVGSEPKKLTVRNISHEHPYEVHPDSPLREVVEEMASKRYGSAIVVQNGKLVGIFTTVDALKALSNILQTRYHEH